MQHLVREARASSKSLEEAWPGGTQLEAISLNQSFSSKLRDFLGHIFPRNAFIARDGIVAVDDQLRLGSAIPLSVNVRSLKRLCANDESGTATSPELIFGFTDYGAASCQIQSSGLSELADSKLNNSLLCFAEDLMAGKSSRLIDVRVSAASGSHDHAKMLLLPKDYDGPIFVCDIDDTLRATSSLKVALGLEHTPLPGIKEMLNAIAAEGVPIVYVSAAPDRFRCYNETFLQHFPAGVLLNRSEAGIKSFLKPNAFQAREQAQFKADILGKIIKTFPRAQLLGLGDDNFGDAMAYNNHGIEAFIRDVRAGEDNLPANFHGTQVRDYSPQVAQLVLKQVKECIERSESFGYPHGEVDYYQRLGNKLDKLTNTKSSAGNSVEFLIGGDRAREAFINEIKSAQSSIHMEMFQFLPNQGVTKEIAAELVKAHQRGVAVRLVFDALGSRHFPIFGNSQIEELQQAGLDVRIYNPLKSLFRKGFERNHRKVLIADGETALIGGMNIGDEYLGSQSKTPVLHDLHARVKGPAVLELLDHFADSYQVACDGAKLEQAKSDSLKDREISASASSDSVKLRIVAHVPGQDRNIRAVYLSLINHAQDHIFIENPYPFARDIVLALIAAAQRGVAVRYVIGSGHGLIDDAARAVLPLLLKTGARVYAYPGRLHTKAISIDGKVCAFGSSNFDEVALHQNREILAVAEDPQLAAKLEKELFVRDFFYQSPKGQKTKKYKHEEGEPLYKRIFKDVMLVLWPERFK